MIYSKVGVVPHAHQAKANEIPKSKKRAILSVKLIGKDCVFHDELNLFSPELQRCLSPQVLQQLAKEIGFVQRSTKFRAQELVALYVWLSTSGEHLFNTSM